MKQKVLWMLLALIIGSNCVMAQKKELKTEEGGFQWYKITDKSGHEGAEDKNGRTLIPISRGYTFICYHKGNGSEGYFTVEGDEKEGVCDIRGKEIVPPIYHSVCRHGGSNGDPYYIGIESKDEKEGVCDMSGKVIFQPIYESIIYSDNNFKIEVDGEWKETEISLNHDGIASGTYNGGSYSASNSNSNRSSSYTSSKPTVKELFEEAYNTSDSEAQLKYDRYQKVLQADPKNVYGYKSLVYNNIGCLYDNLGDKKNARDYFEAALKINPNNENTKKNLKSVKRKIRAENWSNIGNALGFIMVRQEVILEIQLVVPQVAVQYIQNVQVVMVLVVVLVVRGKAINLILIVGMMTNAQVVEEKAVALFVTEGESYSRNHRLRDDSEVNPKVWTD